MRPVYSVLTEETLEMGQGGQLGQKDEGRTPPGGAVIPGQNHLHYLYMHLETKGTPCTQ